jgi:hypothetical protein
MRSRGFRLCCNGGYEGGLIVCGNGGWVGRDFVGSMCIAEVDGW